MTKPTAQQLQSLRREPLEILKDVREQIGIANPPKEESKEAPVSQKPQEEVKPRNLSFLNEYKQELEEIRRDNLFKELQKKISEGEEIPLENYQKELSFEQREVLKAQMEAIKTKRKIEAENQKTSSLPEIVSKKARGMMGTITKRNQQHVETRQAPSS